MATWNTDPAHSSVEFSAKHLMVSTVRGRFGTFNAVLEFDEDNPAASSVEATIETGSITTGATDRDNHLRSGDFLESEKFPTMTFKSTAVEVTGENKGKVTGDLTLRGATKPVTLDVDYIGKLTDPWGNARVAFEASATINREEWGLTWNKALETGGVLVGRDIKIMLDFAFVKVTEAEAV